MFGFMATLFMLFASMPYAFAVDADSSSSSSSACTPVNPAGVGITSPTGSDAGTYTYNSCTGLWVNPHYTWSPATETATPKTPYVYTCNQTKWDWNYQQWLYDPANKSWEQITVTVAQLPVGAIIASDSLTVCAPPPPPSTVIPDSSTSSNSGPGSSSTINGNTTNNTTLNSNNNATVTNQVNSKSQSGDAGVIGNTSAGGATSGNAVALSNDINSLQSSTSLAGPVTTFVANINGNVQGNLIVDPSQLQPANQTLDSTNNLTVNTQNNGQINNTLNLNAASGNATVNDNTNAGSATSGNAEAIANVVNMIDSVISSGKSFIGVININGNLTGDILMPQSFLNSLIASNAPSTTVNISNTVANSLGINTTNNQAINNTVTSSATSGNATENGNTNSGSATTGKTSTSVTLFNLTGNEIIGTNALLVFVNVPGSWVGVIMNAPGATAAALGGDISQNIANNATINTTNNNAINNNVNVAAASGNATVNDNNNAGNATSGNAETVVNFLNLNNTQFNLTGWFGILFINVFGTWVGNFGVYTPPVTTTSNSSSTSQTTSNTKPRVFSFESTSGNDTTGASSGSNLNNAQLISKKSVLGSATVATLHNPVVATVVPVSHTAQIIGGILLILGLGTLIGQNFISSHSVKSSPKRK
jgi:hypothetical protein